MTVPDIVPGVYRMNRSLSGPGPVRLAAAVLLLSAIAAVSRAQCTGCANPSFRAARSYPSNALFFSEIAVGDLDRDGIPDVVALQWDSQVAVLRGTPTGGLAAPVTASLPDSNPYVSLTIGDFDGDGNPDVAVGTGFEAVYLFLGNGDGTLQPASTIPTLEKVYRLASGDFNGDGKRDIAYIDEAFFQAIIFLRLGNGLGGFAASIPVPATSPGDLLVADFNGDEIDDIATVNGSTVAILLGKSSGVFTEPIRNYEVGSSAASVVMGDWNEDGRPDLAASNFEHGITLLLGTPDGFQTGPFVTGGPPAVLLDSGDFNGDGHDDLLLTDIANRLHFLAGNGASSFAGPVLAGIGSDVVPADVNRDGITDLASASGQVSVLLGTPSGRFFEMLAFDPASSGPVVGSFDLDSRPDVVLTTTSGITPVWNDPSGFVAGPSFPGELVVAAADMNLDGRDDLIAKTIFLPVNYVVVYLAAGDRGFTRRDPHNVIVGSLVTADFNEDSRMDAAILDGAGVRLLFGDGTGDFSGEATFSVGNGPAQLVAADFNHDFNVDLAVARNDGVLVVLLGNGAGSFSSIATFTAGQFPIQIAASDVNGDSHVDLVALVNFGNSIAVLAGNGLGGFAAPSNVPLSPMGSSFALADFNADSHVDLAVSRGASGVQTYLGNGLGGFSQSHVYFTGFGSSRVVAADFDLDGRVDLAVLVDAFESAALLFLRNTNCRVRHLTLAVDAPSCPSPGVAFSPQPVARVIDDGENLLSCEAGPVTASILPGTGTPGAVLGGDTMVDAVAGVATFTDLSVDLPGAGYRLELSHPVAGKARTRTFSQGISVAIAGPTHACANAPVLYDAGAGYDSYQWTLDSVPYARTRRVTLSGLSPGSHQLAVTVERDGCSVGNTLSIDVDASPATPVTAPSEVCPYSAGHTASVPDAGPGAMYAWSVTNGVITAGAGTRTVTFRVGPAGQAVLTVTVTNAAGCSSAQTKIVTVNAGLTCPGPVGFFTVTPCRVADTRQPNGPNGGPPLAGNSTRTFPIAGQCGIPPTARSVSVNLTVVGPSASGHLTLFPGNTPIPLVSTINFRVGLTRANNAIAALGASGDVGVLCVLGTPGTVGLVLDVNGYFE